MLAYDTLHPRSADTGRFTDREHTEPELTLGAGHAPSLIAVQTVNDAAPIGAVTASIVRDDWTGALSISRYADHNGRTVPSDTIADVNAELAHATPAGIAGARGVTAHNEDGEVWFTVTLDD